MKKFIILFLLSISGFMANACAVCEKQQPKLLRGITHGTGPDSRWDYLIVWIAVLLVVLTLYFSVKWLIKPGERSENHIKNMIFNVD